MAETKKQVAEELWDMFSKWRQLCKHFADIQLTTIMHCLDALKNMRCKGSQDNRLCAYLHLILDLPDGSLRVILLLVWTSASDFYRPKLRLNWCLMPYESLAWMTEQ